MRCIDNEIILQRRVGPLMYVYIMTIIVIILSLIILFILCYYKTYYDVKGIVILDNDKFYIKSFVPIDYLCYITDNNVVKINNVSYDYDIVSINNEYFTDNANTYQIVVISVMLDKKYRFNNMTVNLKFLKEEKKIIDYIFK